MDFICKKCNADLKSVGVEKVERMCDIYYSIKWSEKYKEWHVIEQSESPGDSSEYTCGKCNSLLPKEITNEMTV